MLPKTVVSALVALTLVMLACGADPKPPQTFGREGGERAEVELFVFSHNSPHISVIDTSTNKVIGTSDIPDFTRWSSNDDHNYFDGQNLWLGMKYPEKDDAILIALDLDTLNVAARLPMGKEKLHLFIGQATDEGILYVAKQASGQMVTVDTNNFSILSTRDVPVHGGEACDTDIWVGPDGIPRLFYPTRQGDTVVSMNAESWETIEVVETPSGTSPLMLTVADDGKVWVQESGSNTNAVFDPISMELIKRFPSSRHPEVATFSPDGKLAYIGHSGDSIVQVIDTETLTEVKKIVVGDNPHKVAVHPNGKYIYAIVSKAKAVAVIDTETWNVVHRIDLGANPTGIFLRSRHEETDATLQKNQEVPTLVMKNNVLSESENISLNLASNVTAKPLSLDTPIDFRFSLVQGDKLWSNIVGEQRQLTLKDAVGKGKPLVVHFTSTSCATCQDDMLIYQGVYHERQNEFLLLVVDVSTLKDRIEEMFQALDFTSPYGNAPEGRPVSLYELYRIPATLLITDDGQLWKKILWRADTPQLRALVTGLINKEEIQIPPASEFNHVSEWAPGR